MSDDKDKVLFPVGRLVQGNLYRPKTTDGDGNQLVYSNGERAGQPRPNFFFAIAVKKMGEADWKHTAWGQKVVEFGKSVFKDNQTLSPNFAWKISDGDSMIPNTKGRKPCENEGFPGNWIIRFGSDKATIIYNQDGTRLLVDKDLVNPGDWIEVVAGMKSNNSSQSPGIHLNHLAVAFRCYGERIETANQIDVATVGFGKSQLPPGVVASETPLSGGVAPGVAEVAPPPAPAPAPHTAILTPPAPVPPAPPAAPVRVMTALAEGIPYESYNAGGWTDEMLIQTGKMTA